MLSDKRFTYYQPEYYSDDSTNIEYGGLPDGLFSFQAFPTREECEEWLKNNNYWPGDFVIHEYHDDDIEDVSLIDRNGDELVMIEDLEEDGLVNLIGDEVLHSAGSVGDLKTARRAGETRQEYEVRVYKEAMDHVNDAIVSIEESGEYNFQSYCGTPEVEWYDKAREWAVKDVMTWMTEDQDMKRENYITEHLAMGILETGKKLVYGVLNTARYDVTGYAFVAGDTPDCLDDLGCSPEDIALADKMAVGETLNADWPVDRAVIIIKMRDDRFDGE